MCSQMSTSSIINRAKDAIISDVTDRLKADQEVFGQRQALAGSLSPILKMMRIWGFYFGRHGRTWTRVHSQETQLQESERYKNNDGGKRQMVYSTIVLLILWANALRCFLAFEQGDKFDTRTIRKIVFVLIFLQCAVMQTSYYIASWSGSLDHILERLNVTQKFADQIYKYSFACVACNSVTAVSSIAGTVYAMFFFDGSFDFGVAPFTTLIPIDGTMLNVLKALMFLVYSFVMQAWIWPLLTNLMMTAILCLLFRQFNDRFWKELNRRGQFSGNLKTFRSRHQSLCEIVCIADSFIRLGNVASIVCQMAIVTVLLFQLTIIGFIDAFNGLVFLLLFLVNAVALSICTISGILVNDVVSDILTSHNPNSNTDF
jgi:hypothetical protein